MKILHIVKDEKFIDTAYDIFNIAYPGDNTFWLFSSSEVKFVKKTPFVKKSYCSVFSKKLKNEIKEYDVVFVHWLGVVGSVLVNKYSKETNFAWIGWGGDYYEFINHNLYEEQTLKNLEVLKKKISFFNLRELTKKIVYSSLDLLGLGKKNAISKLKGFAPVLENEYDLVKSSIGHLPKLYLWNYGILEKHLVIKDFRIGENSTSILLGNSATASNNHLDVIDKLNKISNIDNVVVPLSYGDTSYRDLLVEELPKTSNLNFKFLVSFLPHEKYFELLKECNVVVMNHLRQQGYGNIIFSLYSGAKVYLNGKSPLFSYLSGKGIRVFDINKMDGNEELSSDETQQNRDILHSIFDENVIIEKTKRMVDECKRCQ